MISGPSRARSMLFTLLFILIVYHSLQHFNHSSLENLSVVLFPGQGSPPPPPPLLQLFIACFRTEKLGEGMGLNYCRTTGLASIWELGAECSVVTCTEGTTDNYVSGYS